jgi:hypothetical protein
MNNNSENLDETVKRLQKTYARFNIPKYEENIDSVIIDESTNEIIFKQNKQNNNKPEADESINKDKNDNKYNKKYKELRKNNKSLRADTEAEQYIENLRDIGEYNRWSLKLVQNWLHLFYKGKSIIIYKKKNSGLKLV